MIRKNRCLTFLIALFVLGASVLYAGANPNFRMSEIQKNNNQNASTVRSDILSSRSGDRKTVIIRGTIDGNGTFVFQEDKIIYRNGSFNYPTNVTVGGKVWRNLDEPFDLGFMPVFSSGVLLEKEGRNAETIRLTKYEDHAELYLYDSASSSAPYRISIAFDDGSALQRKKAEEQKKAETRRKAEERKKAADDDGGEFYVSMPPKKDKNAKNEKVSADSKTGADAKRKFGEQEKLQGVLYFLKPSKNGNSAKAVVNRAGVNKSQAPPDLKKFVLGNWRQVSDAAGNRHYPELDQLFKRQSAPSFSYFYQKSIPWEEGAELFLADPKGKDFFDDSKIEEIRGSGWTAIYSGYVRAPFSGKFRFLGIGDDVLVVRFNRQIVLDYGWVSLTTGIELDANFEPDFFSILSGKPKTAEEKRQIAGSPLYSKQKLEVSYLSAEDDHGLARSPVLNVERGQIIPIEILLLEQCSNLFRVILLVERLDSNGRSLNDPKFISLFRTTPELPDIPSDSSLPSFNPDGLVWRVVDPNGKSLSP